jgi:hypothetical protein
MFVGQNRTTITRTSNVLKGNCNRCGNCCVIGDSRCTNLLGELGNTTCAVYAVRYLDMPIIMRDSQGNELNAYCAHGSRQEEDILTRLILEGKCSLEVSDG